MQSAPIDLVFTLYVVVVGLVSVEPAQEHLQCACGGWLGDGVIAK